MTNKSSLLHDTEVFFGLLIIGIFLLMSVWHMGHLLDTDSSGVSTSLSCEMSFFLVLSVFLRMWVRFNPLNTLSMTTNKVFVCGLLILSVFLHTWVRYRVARMHRVPYLCRSFFAKEPYNSRLFGGKKPATYGILCMFATLYIGRCCRNTGLCSRNTGIFCRNAPVCGLLILIVFNRMWVRYRGPCAEGHVQRAM